MEGDSEVGVWGQCKAGLIAQISQTALGMHRFEGLETDKEPLGWSSQESCPGLGDRAAPHPLCPGTTGGKAGHTKNFNMI